MARPGVLRCTPKRSLISGLVAAASLLLAGEAVAQDSPPMDAGQLLDYAYLFSSPDNGATFSSLGQGAQSTNLLSIPISIWMRRLPCCGNPITPNTEGRTFGIRLRLTGVFGFAEFDKIEDFDVNSVDLGAVFPGIELLFKTGERSMLRPYIDVGWAGASEADNSILYGELGLRTEFVFPWKRWELGIEPRLKGGYSFTDLEDADLSNVEISAKMDARYPLGFTIGGQHPDVGAYFQPSWFPNDISFATESGIQGSVQSQFEVGATFGFRYLAPMLCGLFRMPRLGFGYRFGGDTAGWRLTIGGDRVTRLPLP